MTVLWDLLERHYNMTIIITMPYDISITEGSFLKVMEMASENMIYVYLQCTRGRATS